MELERFTPGLDGEIWYEHWHRYHFAAPLADARHVLDIACGEGYGCALLARRAAHVTGIDASADIIAHARRRYGALANVEYLQGRCESIPLADASVDLAVSFETIEHIAAPAKLVGEIARVLRPGGLFVVSTPNKEVYSDRRNYRNAHHVSELYHDEFVALLRTRFPEVALLGQRVDAYSAIWPLSVAPSGARLFDARRNEAAEAAPGIADPMYYIAVCGNDGHATADAARAFSLLSDRDHWLFEDYRSVTQRLADLEAHVARVEAAYQASQQQLAAMSQERAGLLARLDSTHPAAPGGGWRKR